MSKKGPRSDTYHILTASLSDEVMARYLEIAHHVREKEKARRRQAERRKAAEKKKRETLLFALFGWKPPKKAKDKRKKSKTGTVSASGTGLEPRVQPAARNRGNPKAGAAQDTGNGFSEIIDRAHSGGSRQAKPITREEILKLLVADDLGYLEKVRTDGWGGLSCAETGRVGGMMTSKMQRLKRGLLPFQSF